MLHHLIVDDQIEVVRRKRNPVVFHPLYDGVQHTVRYLPGVVPSFIKYVTPESFNAAFSQLVDNLTRTTSVIQHTSGIVIIVVGKLRTVFVVIHSRVLLNPEWRRAFPKSQIFH